MKKIRSSALTQQSVQKHKRHVPLVPVNCKQFVMCEISRTGKNINPASISAHLGDQAQNTVVPSTTHVTGKVRACKLQVSTAQNVI